MIRPIGVTLDSFPDTLACCSNLSQVCAYLRMLAALHFQELKIRIKGGAHILEVADPEDEAQAPTKNSTREWNLRPSQSLIHGLVDGESDSSPCRGKEEVDVSVLRFAMCSVDLRCRITHPLASFYSHFAANRVDKWVPLWTMTEPQ